MESLAVVSVWTVSEERRRHNREEGRITSIHLWSVSGSAEMKVVVVKWWKTNFIGGMRIGGMTDGDCMKGTAELKPLSRGVLCKYN